MIGRRSFPLSRFVMGMFLFSILLLIPLISAADSVNTADLGFTCDDKKCTFSLAIPQSAVSFVDVGFLEDEISALSQNVTDLKNNENLINQEEDQFNTDFDALYYDAQSNLTEMFDLCESLKNTSTKLVNDASNVKNQTATLSKALKCMTEGVYTPAVCGQDVDLAPTTPSPDEPTGQTDKPEEPFTGSTTTVEPFTGTTTTEAPFTGTTTTEAPFTGSTTTEEVQTTTTGPTEATQSTTEAASEGTVTTGSPATDGTSPSSSTDATSTTSSQDVTSPSTEIPTTSCTGGPPCP